MIYFIFFQVSFKFVYPQISKLDKPPELFAIIPIVLILRPSRRDHDSESPILGKLRRSQLPGVRKQKWRLWSPGFPK